MKFETYTVTARRNIDCELVDIESIRVMAQGHMQHIHSETKLVGVSNAGVKRLNAFDKKHAGAQLVVDAGRYMPKLVGWTTEMDK